MILNQQMKQVILIIVLLNVSLVSYCRSVDIYIFKGDNKINTVETNISINDSTNREYEYIAPGELKIYEVSYLDTQCIFISPCVAEYIMHNENRFSFYFWTNKIICPDECFCVQEDSDVVCSMDVGDAGVCMTVCVLDGNVDYYITTMIDLCKLAGDYSQYLIMEIEGQKENGTTMSAVYWANTYETIIHNSLFFHLLSDKHLQTNEIHDLSVQFKRQ